MVPELRLLWSPYFLQGVALPLNCFPWQKDPVLNIKSYTSSSLHRHMAIVGFWVSIKGITFIQGLEYPAMSIFFRSAFRKHGYLGRWEMWIQACQACRMVKITSQRRKAAYSFVCLRWCVIFYHGKSPLKHHLGSICLFFQPPQANLSTVFHHPVFGSIPSYSEKDGWSCHEPRPRILLVTRRTLCDSYNDLCYRWWFQILCSPLLEKDSDFNADFSKMDGNHNQLLVFLPRLTIRKRCCHQIFHAWQCYVGTLSWDMNSSRQIIATCSRRLVTPNDGSVRESSPKKPSLRFGNYSNLPKIIAVSSLFTPIFFDTDYNISTDISQWYEARS